MRNIFIDTSNYQLADKYSDPKISPKTNQLPQTKTQAGKEYSLLGISKKKYTPGSRILIGTSALGKTVFTLGFGLISENIREDFKTFWTGKRSVAIYNFKNKAAIGPENVPFQDDAPLEFLPSQRPLISRIFSEVEFKADSDEATKFLQLISSISKSFAPVAENIEINLLNSGKACLKDIPGLKTKNDVFTFIQLHKDHLKCLDFTGFTTNRLLTTWGLTDNDITTIVHDCPNLESLVTSFSHISNRGMEEILQLTQLKKLDITSQKNLINLPSLAALEHLQELSIYSGSLQNIPSLGELSNLHHLTLKCDAIQSLPSFDHLKNLKTLRFDGYSLAHLPSLDKLKNLQHLSLNSSSLEVPSLDALKNLQRLKLFCGSQAIPSFDKLKNLQHLSLACTVEVLPSFDELKNLRVLRIFSTDSELISLHELENLVYLYIDSPSLQELPSLDHMTQLKHVILKVSDWNLLSSNDFSQLVNLEELSLNHIRKVPLPPEISFTPPPNSQALKINDLDSYNWYADADPDF